MKQNKKIRFSIGLKLILIISVIFTISFAVMIYIATDLFRNDMTAFIENNNHQISLSTGQSLEVYIKNIFEKSLSDAEALAKQSGSKINKAGDSDTEKDTLFQSDRDEIIEIALLSKGETGLVIDKELSDEEFFTVNKIAPETIEKLINEKKDELDNTFNLHVSIFNVSSYFDSPAMALTIPYQIDGKESASQVLLAVITTETLSNIIKSDDITTTYIINEKGNILVHPDLRLVVTNSDIVKLPIYQEFHTNALDNGQKHFTEEGVKKIASYQRINFAGFSLGVITTVNENRAFGAVFRVQKRNALIAVIIVVLVIMFLYFYAKTITVPVGRLVSVSHEIEKGNYDVSLKPKYRDEVGVLTESFNSMAEGLLEKERIKDAFGKFVNPEIAEKVSKEELTLGGETKNAAVFFSDIRSFTAISEKLEAHQVVEFLNEYMTLMVDCIDKTHGVVDKFIGDAIMALWGTPVSKGNDSENSINAALMMRQALIAYNKGRGNTPDKPLIKIGCGINTGPLVAGQIGSNNRMEYTVIGDTVNLASRIESLNKPFRTDILITQDTYDLVRDIFIVEPMKKITVKGKSEPQQVYAVINRKDATEGPRTLSEVRGLIGWEDIDISGVNADESEEKYTIVE